MNNDISKTKKYKHLSFEERIKLQVLLEEKNTITGISIKLKRNKATVSREISRNKNQNSYEYGSNFAHQKSKSRKKYSCKKQWLKNRNTRELVAELIQEQHSPRTVVKILKDKYNLQTNYESIYQWIYKNRPDLIDFLYQKHRQRLKRGNKKKARVLIKNKIDISQRPQEVNSREGFGDFEFDLVVSSKSKTSILTILERKSRYCIFRLLPDKKASTVSKELIFQLQRFGKDFVKTLTCDNGLENASHKDVDKELDCQTYFCKPYHSWEKGSVENANKLLRRFLPKGTDFSLINKNNLCIIQDKINMIPRKALSFQSASEVIAVALAH